MKRKKSVNREFKIWLYLSSASLTAIMIVGYSYVYNLLRSSEEIFAYQLLTVRWEFEKEVVFPAATYSEEQSRFIDQKINRLLESSKKANIPLCSFKIISADSLSIAKSSLESIDFYSISESIRLDSGYFQDESRYIIFLPIIHPNHPIKYVRKDIEKKLLKNVKSYRFEFQGLATILALGLFAIVGLVQAYSLFNDSFSQLLGSVSMILSRAKLLEPPYETYPIEINPLVKMAESIIAKSENLKEENKRLKRIHRSGNSSEGLRNYPRIIYLAKRLFNEPNKEILDMSNSAKRLCSFILLCSAQNGSHSKIERCSLQNLLAFTDIKGLKNEVTLLNSGIEFPRQVFIDFLNQNPLKSIEYKRGRVLIFEFANPLQKYLTDSLELNGCIVNNNQRVSIPIIKLS